MSIIEIIGILLLLIMGLSALACSSFIPFGIAAEPLLALPANKTQSAFTPKPTA